MDNLDYSSMVNLGPSAMDNIGSNSIDNLGPTSMSNLGPSSNNYFKYCPHTGFSNMSRKMHAPRSQINEIDQNY